MPTTIQAYTFAELQGKARDRAIDALPEPDCELTLEECMDSLKALCKLAGVTLKDWEIGPYSFSYIKVEIGGPVEGDGPGALTGPRAFAWIENNIFGKLRQGWSLKDKGRKYTRPEHVPCSPLTGVCFDEDLLDVFRDKDASVTIEERFESLGGVISRICEQELEYQAGEGLSERLDMIYDGALFTEAGKRIN